MTPKVSTRPAKGKANSLFSSFHRTLRKVVGPQYLPRVLGEQILLLSIEICSDKRPPRTTEKESGLNSAGGCNLTNSADASASTQTWGHVLCCAKGRPHSLHPSVVVSRSVGLKDSCTLLCVLLGGKLVPTSLGKHPFCFALFLQHVSDALMVRNSGLFTQAVRTYPQPQWLLF